MCPAPDAVPLVGKLVRVRDGAAYRVSIVAVQGPVNRACVSIASGADFFYLLKEMGITHDAFRRVDSI
jgi:hypothetical protein